MKLRPTITWPGLYASTNGGIFIRESDEEFTELERMDGSSRALVEYQGLCVLVEFAVMESETGTAIDPDSERIEFADGNHQNCQLDNLVLMNSVPSQMMPAAHKSPRRHRTGNQRKPAV